MRNIVKFKEQGFCFGVSRSIEIVQKTIDNPNTKKPIYLLGSLVHNHHVNDYFTKNGVIVLNNKTRLEMLDEIVEGTVIITAHGVSDKVIKKAKLKNLDVVDATCPYVIKTVKRIIEFVNKGYKLVYIGKLNHPEVETILDEVENAVIIEQNKDIPILPNSKVILAHQTTLSDYDVETTIKEIKKKYANVELLKQICVFPENRQQEINNYIFPKGNNLCLVVGDKISNNATKLKELLIRRNVGDVKLINSFDELKKHSLDKYNNIFIASGTSTPIDVVNDIYIKLGGR